MKNRIFRTLLTLALALFTLPMLSQDFMNIYFKNGDFRKFYMKNITEIAASKVDAEGVQHSDYCYQRITTIYDTYIYSLEDVDSITFTKIDEEKAEHNFVTAMPEVFSAIDGCETIEDVEEKIDQIKNAEGVADAWSDGHMLHVTIAEGETFSFHFNHDIDEDLSSIKNVTSEVRSLFPRLEAIKQKNQKLKVVIANQQDKDEKKATHKTGIFYPLRDDLEKCGITAIYEENPSVEFFYNNSDDPKHLNVYDYDIVILSTHGSYDYNPQYINGELSYTNKIHSFATSDSFIFDHGVDRPGWVDNYPAFKDWRDETRFRDATDAQINYGFYPEIRNNKEVWVAHPELTELFFSDFAKGRFHNKKSILFNCACESLKGNNYSLADALFAHDLGVYMGYTEKNRFGQIASYFLLEGMLQGASLETVKEGFPEYCTYETLENVMKRPGDFSADNLELIKKEGLYQARLEILPHNNDDILSLFLLPPYSEQIDQKAVNEEYNESQTVTVKGSATIFNFNPENVKAGFALSCFEYGQNPIGATQFIKAEIVPVNYKGKIDFSAKLRNLERGKTYQYRAYTDDGLHRNYGDFYSFTIDGGTNPRPDINLTPGTKFITRTKEDVEVTYTVTANDSKNDKYTCKIENGLNTGQGGIRQRRANGTIAPAISLDTEGTVTIPESAACFFVTEVGINAFKDCGKVTAINLPETIEEIGESAMSGCVGLSSITIPKNVKKIDRNAFGGCKNVKSIYAEMTTPFSIAENVFQTASEEQAGTPSTIFANATLYVPVGSKNQYATTPGWNKFQRIDEYTPGNSNMPDVAEAVDLRLPSGTKWANMNIGATKPEDYGLYFAWGETVGYGNDTSDGHSFDADSYVWFDKVNNYRKLTKYCTNLDYGIIDNKTVLDANNDAATVNWGIEWRMPTEEDVRELKEFCISEPASINGVSGRKYTSKINGKSIFLPAAGLRRESDLSLAGSNGNYWSSTLHESQPETAFSFYFFGGHYYCDDGPTYRPFGLSVRPVTTSNHVNPIDGNVITFADPKVKAICVQRWDINYDGELSYSEAAAVTDLGFVVFENMFIQSSAFMGNEDITSFDELQYFVGLKVIKDNAFYGCSSLKSIVIPNAVTSIGDNAFHGCSSLNSITIPNTVTSIGSSAFAYCYGLTSIIISNSLTRIADNVFFGCSSLTSIVIPNSVTSIENSAFRFCNNLTSVVIPESVVNIGSSAFGDCRSLLSINIPRTVTIINNEVFCGCSSLTSAGIPNSIKDIGKRAFAYCSNLKELVSHINDPFTIDSSVFDGIPKDAILYVPTGTKVKYEATEGWNRFKNIVEMGGETPGPDASIISFADPKVKAICVANWDTNGDGELSKDEAAAVTDLGEVFKENEEITSFDELQYFTGLSSIGKRAFFACTGLATIRIPNSVKIIDTYSFQSCKSLVSVTIPKGVTSIASGAFWNCTSLTSIDVDEGNSVYVSENGILFDKNLTTIMCYPNGKPENTYVIPNSVAIIGDWAFTESYNLTTIIIPESVISIGKYAFAHCYELTSIIIGNSVASIGENAFQQCNNLNSLTIPSSVTKIERCAFEFCDNLSEVISYINEPFTINNNVFLLTDRTHYSNAILYVPAGTKAKYEATEGWKNFKNIVEMGGDDDPVSQQEIDKLNAELDNLIPQISEAWSKLYNKTFGEEERFAADIYGKLSEFSTRMQQCRTMLSVVKTQKEMESLKAEVASIAELLSTATQQTEAFSLSFGDTFVATSAEGIELKFTVLSAQEKTCLVGDMSQQNYHSALTNFDQTGSVTVPATVNYNGETYKVTEIGPGAFSSCRLSFINIPSVSHIWMNAFWFSQITEITIPESVTGMGPQIFSRCSQLKKVTCLIKEPFVIDASMFDGIPADATLYVPAGTKARYEATEGWKNFKNIVEME